MKRRKLFLVGILAAFFAASIFTTACNGANTPPKPSIPDEPKPEALQQLSYEEITKALDGKIYDRYKIEWIDAAGNKRTKVITAEDAKNNVALPGGIKAGTKVTITPQVKTAQGSMKISRMLRKRQHLLPVVQTGSSISKQVSMNSTIRSRIMMPHLHGLKMPTVLKKITLPRRITQRYSWQPSA